MHTLHTHYRGTWWKTHLQWMSKWAEQTGRNTGLFYDWCRRRNEERRRRWSWLNVIRRTRLSTISDRAFPFAASYCGTLCPRRTSRQHRMSVLRIPISSIVLSPNSPQCPRSDVVILGHYSRSFYAYMTFYSLTDRSHNSDLLVKFDESGRVLGVGYPRRRRRPGRRDRRQRATRGRGRRCARRRCVGRRRWTGGSGQLHGGAVVDGAQQVGANTGAAADRRVRRDAEWRRGRDAARVGCWRAALDAVPHTHTHTRTADSTTAIIIAAFPNLFLTCYPKSHPDVGRYLPSLAPITHK